MSSHARAETDTHSPHDHALIYTSWTEGYFQTHCEQSNYVATYGHSISATNLFELDNQLNNYRVIYYQENIHNLCVNIVNTIYKSVEACLFEIGVYFYSFK